MSTDVHTDLWGLAGDRASSKARGQVVHHRVDRRAEFSFLIDLRPPFRLDLTVWALRRRSVNETDRWDGSEYGRTIYLGRTPVGLGVKQVGFHALPRLLVRVSGERDSARVRAAVHHVLHYVLGLGIDLAGFYALAAAEPPLDELAMRFRGMRPPRFPSVFEALVNGVACQQISLQAGLTVLNRLVAAFGQAPSLSLEGERAFPKPEALAEIEVHALRAVGFSLAKSHAIREIAIAAARGELEYEALARLDDAAALARLDKLRGVGRWTAEYVLLRGCGRLNIFPGDDVGARNNLQRWLRRRRLLDYDSTKKLLQRWQPYSGLVYLHLLLKRLDDEATMTTAGAPQSIEPSALDRSQGRTSPGPLERERP